MTDLAKNLSQLSETLEAIVTSYKEEEPVTPKNEVPATEETKETKKVSLEEIRAVLAEKSQAGLTSKVKELLESFGANKLSSVKEEDFEKLLAAAQRL